MKKVILIISAVVMTLGILSSFSGGDSIDENASTEYVTLYGERELTESVTIGDQVWMAKNLNVEKFRNGDPIPHVKTNEEWEKAGRLGEPAWCYYNNDPANGVKYGKLYNIYAVRDPRGLAPEGWHVPSGREWNKLTDFLGFADYDAAIKMKSTRGWAENNNGTNESGFSGLPGGSRNHDGRFYFLGKNGYWWSTTGGYNYQTETRSLLSSSSKVHRDSYYGAMGFSVRCLKGNVYKEYQYR